MAATGAVVIREALSALVLIGCIVYGAITGHKAKERR